MKVENIINCLETVYGDELIMSYHINAVNHAIAFLKAYQERVKELEEAYGDATKAQKVLTGDYESSYLADCIEGELLILKSFYEEGDGLLEEEKSGAVSSFPAQEMEEKKGYDHNSKEKPSFLSTQRFA